MFFYIFIFFQVFLNKLFIKFFSIFLMFFSCCCLKFETHTRIHWPLLGKFICFWFLILLRNYLLFNRYYLSSIIIIIIIIAIILSVFHLLLNINFLLFFFSLFLILIFFYCFLQINLYGIFKIFWIFINSVSIC